MRGPLATWLASLLGICLDTSLSSSRLGDQFQEHKAWTSKILGCKNANADRFFLCATCCCMGRNIHTTLSLHQEIRRYHFGFRTWRIADLSLSPRRAPRTACVNPYRFCTGVVTLWFDRSQRARGIMAVCDCFIPLEVCMQIRNINMNERADSYKNVCTWLSISMYMWMSENLWK